MVHRLREAAALTPAQYEKVRAKLAPDSGCTEAERATARRMCAEYEAAHPGARVRGRVRFDGSFAGSGPPPPRPTTVPVEHDMRDLCATCGKDWALHWVAQRIPRDQIRPQARTCGAFVPKMKPPHRHYRAGWSVPWWRLVIYKVSSSKKLGLTIEFRQALRRLRADIEQPRARKEEGFYRMDPGCAEMVERGEVDWRWFPEEEPPPSKGPWRPPPEMREAMRSTAKKRKR